MAVAEAVAMEAEVRGKARGGGSTPRPSSVKTEGLCPDLKGYIFDCGERGSAEQAQKTMERIALYCGKTMNMDISKELTNRARLVIPEPEYPPEALEMQEKEEIMKANKLTQLMEVWEPKIEALNRQERSADFGRTNGVGKTPE